VNDGVSVTVGDSVDVGVSVGVSANAPQAGENAPKPMINKNPKIRIPKRGYR
jgi:hypothetical protein